MCVCVCVTHFFLDHVFTADESIPVKAIFQHRKQFRPIRNKPCRDEIVIFSHDNNNGMGQLVHQRSVIRAFLCNVWIVYLVN